MRFFFSIEITNQALKYYISSISQNTQYHVVFHLIHVTALAGFHNVIWLRHPVSMATGFHCNHQQVSELVFSVGNLNKQMNSLSNNAISRMQLRKKRSLRDSIPS